MIKINKHYYIEDGKLHHKCGWFKSAVAYLLHKSPGIPYTYLNVVVRRWVRNEFALESICWNCETRLPKDIEDKARFIDSRLI